MCAYEQSNDIIMMEELQKAWSLSPLLAIGMVLSIIFWLGNWKEKTRKAGCIVSAIVMLIGFLAFVCAAIGSL